MYVSKLTVFSNILLPRLPETKPQRTSLIPMILYEDELSEKLDLPWMLGSNP